MRTAAPVRVAPAAVPARRAAQTPHAPHASPRGRSLRTRVAPGVYEAQADPAQLLVLATTAGLGAFWWCGPPRDAPRGPATPPTSRSGTICYWLSRACAAARRRAREGARWAMACSGQGRHAL